MPFCGECGQAVQPGQKFCTACGKALTGAAATAAGNNRAALSRPTARQAVPASAPPPATSAPQALADVDRLTQDFNDQVNRGQLALVAEYKQLSLKLRRRPDATDADEKMSAHAIAFLDGVLLRTAELFTTEALVKALAEAVRPMLLSMQPGMHAEDSHLMEAQLQKLENWAQETCRMHESLLQAIRPSFEVLGGPEAAEAKLQKLRADMRRQDWRNVT